MRMWQLSNFTPFPVIAGFERDAQGHSHYVVTISASFRIDAAGRAWFDADQPPPLQSPQFLENDPEGLLTADADQGLPHPGIDILLAADAMLAPTEPRRRLTLRLAGMQRDLDLLAPMQRDRRGHAQRVEAAPAPVPLDWRSSWGGVTLAENPLGTGAAGTEGEALPRLIAPDAAIDTELAGDLGPVLGDATQLRQIIHNLLRNAEDALEGRDDARIVIRTARGLRHAWLTIADNGPGFPVELLPRIFEPYVTTKARGTGLGLPIVKKIVEEHQGSIEISNAPEGGARIVIRLPLVKEEEAKNGHHSGR